MNHFLFYQINSLAFRFTWLDTIGIFFAKYLPYLMILIFFVISLKDFKRNKLFFTKGVISSFLGIILTFFIRKIYCLPRPLTFAQTHILISHSLSCSFPSAHTAFLFALSTSIFFKKKLLGKLFLGASFLVGIARVFCGLHWPYDILGGIIVGVFCGYVVEKLAFSKNFIKKWLP